MLDWIERQLLDLDAFLYERWRYGATLTAALFFVSGWTLAAVVYHF